MRVVVQRVNFASVRVAEQEVASIKKGLLILLGFHESDEHCAPEPAIKKILEQRIFPNEAGRFDRSVQDIDGEVLVVPQFTLFADTSKGRRPDFFAAMPPLAAKSKFEAFFIALLKEHPRSQKGTFGADMLVTSQNDGPVTILMDF